MKKILYVVGVLFTIGMVLILSTVMVQFGMEAIANNLEISLKEDLLYTISGGLGVAITGTICAVYVKKKNYLTCIEEHKSFEIRTCAYYSGISFCICSVLFYAIATFIFVNIFSMTKEVNVAVEKSWSDIMWMEIVSPILVAPIFEELLFRMGLYSIIRQKFDKRFSIFLCTILFAVMHGYSLYGFCSCIVAGLLFMLIYVHTGNIWYNIVAHMVCNLSISIFNALEDKGITFLGIPMQYEINGFNMVHPVFVVIALIFCTVCIIKKRKTK